MSVRSDRCRDIFTKFGCFPYFIDGRHFGCPPERQFGMTDGESIPLTELLNVNESGRLFDSRVWLFRNGSAVSRERWSHSTKVVRRSDKLTKSLLFLQGQRAVPSEQAAYQQARLLVACDTLCSRVTRLRCRFTSTPRHPAARHPDISYFRN
jgi:hypothetical protein